ncbi:MAG TPA: sel1 repeat family protein, partial [Stellaceae bacterium]|nr:sel1 repeat family protein [Stellaceae bacterium]
MALTGLILCLCLALPAAAGPVQDGFDAYERKDYATALRLWQQEADKGDVKAEYDLGVLYRDGEGVVQDYAQAVMW